MPTGCAWPRPPARRRCALIGSGRAFGRAHHAAILRERAARAAGDRRLDQCRPAPGGDRRASRPGARPARLQCAERTTPVIVDLKPTGSHYMEDLHAAGGIPAVLRELRPLLHLDVPTVTGETLGERIAAADPWVDRGVIRSRGGPVRVDGGLVALFGTLAPGGAILKRSAADPALFEREAGPWSSTRSRTWHARIDDPQLDVHARGRAGPEERRARPALRRCRKRATCRSRASSPGPASRTCCASRTHG